MSRSFTNGTPSWAQVQTRPVARRVTKKVIVQNELKAVHDDRLADEKEDREIELFWAARTYEEDQTAFTRSLFEREEENDDADYDDLVSSRW
jgi:protein subunit release factor B